MTMSKKIIKRGVVIYEDPDFHSLFLNFDDLVIKIKEIKNRYPDYFNIGFVHDRWFGNKYYDYAIVGDRYETDEEYEKRISRKKKRAESEVKRKATLLKNKEKELQKLKEQVAKLQADMKGE